MPRTVVTYNAGTWDVAGASPTTVPSTVTEADITLANNTTNNVSTTKHGFAPILPNDATKYLDGTGAYSVPAGGGGGGITTYDYVTSSTVLNVSATSDATAETFINGNSVSYDGSTLIRVEFFCPVVASSQVIVSNLYDGSTDLGRVSQCNGITAYLYGSQFLTPSAGAHTFSWRVWRGTGTGSLNPGAGGAGTTMRAWMRITKA